MIPSRTKLYSNIKFPNAEGVLLGLFKSKTTHFLVINHNKNLAVQSSIKFVTDPVTGALGAVTEYRDNAHVDITQDEEGTKLMSTSQTPEGVYSIFLVAIS